nr:hypothetical protein CFP56_28795 [Quercus suber]
MCYAHATDQSIESQTMIRNRGLAAPGTQDGAMLELSVLSQWLSQLGRMSQRGRIDAAESRPARCWGAATGNIDFPAGKDDHLGKLSGYACPSDNASSARMYSSTSSFVTIASVHWRYHVVSQGSNMTVIVSELSARCYRSTLSVGAPRHMPFSLCHGSSTGSAEGYLDHKGLTVEADSTAKYRPGPGLVHHDLSCLAGL